MQGSIILLQFQINPHSIHHPQLSCLDPIALSWCIDLVQPSLIGLTSLTTFYGPLDAPDHKMQWTIRHTRFQKANVGKS